jgi:hypothetical protein
MNFPNLATDSFYKFLTVLGLVLIVFSGKVISDRFVTNRDNEINYLRDSLMFTKEIKDLQIDKEFFQDKIDSSIINNSINIIQQDSLKSVKLKIAKLENEIILKNSLMSLAKEKKMDSGFYLKFITSVSTLLFMMGLGGLLWGFCQWYEKQQKTKDKELLRDYISMGRISMYCNSCGKEISKDEIRPKEKDGSFNYRYCRDCYQDGEFIEPNMTLEMMKKRIINNGNHKIFIWWRLYCLDTMERWRKNKLIPENKKVK